MGCLLGGAGALLGPRTGAISRPGQGDVNRLEAGKSCLRIFSQAANFPPDEGAVGASREVGEGYKYVSLGLTFAGGIIFFMGMGFLLDRWLGWMPILTVAGTLLGAVLSFLNVYWKLQADEKEYDAEHPHASRRKREAP